MYLFPTPAPQAVRLYLDESGTLGFGGEVFTMAMVRVCDLAKLETSIARHKVTQAEIKASQMKTTQKLALAKTLLEENDLEIYLLTIDPAAAYACERKLDKELLYDSMIAQAMAYYLQRGEMQTGCAYRLSLDMRGGIRESFEDMVCASIGGVLMHRAEPLVSDLQIRYMDSKYSAGVQVADLFSNIYRTALSQADSPCNDFLRKGRADGVVHVGFSFGLAELADQMSQIAAELRARVEYEAENNIVSSFRTLPTGTEAVPALEGAVERETAGVAAGGDAGAAGGQEQAGEKADGETAPTELALLQAGTAGGQADEPAKKTPAKRTRRSGRKPAQADAQDSVAREGEGQTEASSASTQDAPAAREAKLGADAPAAGDAQLGGEAQPNGGAQPGGKVQPDVEAQLNAGVQPGRKAQPNRGAQPGTDARPNEGVQPGGEAQASVATQAGREAQANAEAQPGRETQPSGGARADGKAQPNGGAQPVDARPDGGAQPGRESQPSGDARADRKARPTGTQPDVEAQTDMGAQPGQTQSNGEAQTGQEAPRLLSRSARRRRSRAARKASERAEADAASPRAGSEAEGTQRGDTANSQVVIKEEDGRQGEAGAVSPASGDSSATIASTPAEQVIEPPVNTPDSSESASEAPAPASKPTEAQTVHTARERRQKASRKTARGSKKAHEAEGAAQAGGIGAAATAPTAQVDENKSREAKPGLGEAASQAGEAEAHDAWAAAEAPATQASRTKAHDAQADGSETRDTQADGSETRKAQGAPTADAAREEKDAPADAAEASATKETSAAAEAKPKPARRTRTTRSKKLADAHSAGDVQAAPEAAPAPQAEAPEPGDTPSAEAAQPAGPWQAPAADAGQQAPSAADAQPEPQAEASKPARTRTRSRSRSKAKTVDEQPAVVSPESPSAEPAAYHATNVESAETPAAKHVAPAQTPAGSLQSLDADTVPAAKPKPRRTRSRKAAPKPTDSQPGESQG